MRLSALHTILRHAPDGTEELIKGGTVFEASGAEANHLRDLQAAREATPSEVKAADDAVTKARGN